MWPENGDSFVQIAAALKHGSDVVSFNEQSSKRPAIERTALNHSLQFCAEHEQYTSKQNDTEYFHQLIFELHEIR